MGSFHQLDVDTRLAVSGCNGVFLFVIRSVKAVV